MGGGGGAEGRGGPRKGGGKCNKQKKEKGSEKEKNGGEKPKRETSSMGASGGEVRTPLSPHLAQFGCIGSLYIRLMVVKSSQLNKTQIKLTPEHNCPFNCSLGGFDLNP